MHLKNLLETLLKSQLNQLKKIFNSIKFGQFTKNELETILKIIKSRKATGIKEMRPEK